MEETTVRDQPRLSVTEASASAFQGEEMEGFTTGSEDNRSLNEVSTVMDPVLTQPGLGVTTTTITTITQTGGDWSTGLFDVCGDKTTCNVHTTGHYSHKHSAFTCNFVHWVPNNPSQYNMHIVASRFCDFKRQNMSSQTITQNIV
uniref:Uncharacterized protein n=1 Tax=Acanthochromis polyacanthus TaxID=80966 RepID=A0A3Q1GYY1_9TELE